MIRKWLVSVIPVIWRSAIKRYIATVQLLFIRLFASSGALASLYYAFFSSQFHREHKAVLLGRLAYAKSLQHSGQSSALLRRNIHRLEKGLIMQPRRDVFAEAYIVETVECYLAALKSQQLCQQEQKWATDVLTNYFKVVGASQDINTARSLFKSSSAAFNKSSNTATTASIPYPYHTLPACPVTYQQLLTLFQRRRAVRWYQPIPVPDALIRQAVQAASLAPSACNRQPFQFYLANNPLKAADIARCAMGTVGFAENLQCVIAIVGDLSAYPAERDRHVIYIDGALAAMQLMLAFEALGLSTCPINWPDIEPREQLLQQKLGLAYYQRTIMLLAVGYAQPDGGIAFSQKKANALLIKDIA